MIKISVVTVAFNSGNTIAKAIESVLTQTCFPYEYIVIDGKSSDNTVSVASSYASEFEKRNIKYLVVSEPDNGIYDAMNKGIALTTGDVVGMINSDDWYEPIALQTVAETYEKEPFDLFYADLRISTETKSFIKRAKHNRYVTSAHWNHPTTFIARPIYTRFQYDCGEFYADFDFILRLYKQNVKTVIANKVLANFSFGGISNKKNFGLMKKRAKRKYEMYQKNGYSKFYIFECYTIELLKFLFA